MKKKILLLISIIIVLLLTVSCQKDILQTENKNIKFYFPNGTPALAAAKLSKEDPEITEYITMEYKMQESPDLLAASIIKEEPDIAIVPSNLAAQAFNKGLPYKIVGTSTWGTMYLTSTLEINNFQDLKGKEIYTFGRGLTPDIVLRYILSSNGIDPEKDVTITYLNSAQEMGPAFLSNKANIAVLPEPLLSVVMSKDPEAKIVFDLNEEWGNASSTKKGFPQSSLIIKSDLLKNDKDFVESFIESFADSRSWAIDNPEQLGEYAEELGISIEKDIIKKGIRWTNPADFNVEDSILEYNAYYKAILDFAPDFIGGKMPSEEIYFER